MDRKKLLTVSIFGTMIFLACIFAVQGFLLTDVIASFHPESSAQGYANLASAVGGMAAFISAFFLIGRVRKLNLLKTGILVAVVFIGLLSCAGRYSVFIAMWFVAGIGMGYIDTLLSSCIADLYSGAEATKMMCRLHMTFGVGSMASPVAYSALKKAGVVWNRLYLFAAAIGVVMLTVLCLADKRAENVSDRSDSEQKMSLREMAQAVRSGSLPYFIAAIILHGMSYNGVSSWITHYVSVTLAGRLGGIALSFLYFGVLLSRLLFPMTGIPVRKYLPYAGIISGVVFAAGVSFSSDIIVCLATALSALCFGATIPCMLDTACAEMKDKTLFATTVLMMSLYLGQGTAASIVGAIEKGFGLRSGMYFCAVLMAVTGLVLKFWSDKTSD